MGTKVQPLPKKGSVKLEDRYGSVAIRAVAGAIKPPKTQKAD
ncbi:MAG: hypothetical protein ACK4M0_14130 [Phreatobacter sp.]|jgi:hypothetical protein